jgi:predicted nucleotidyltransferase
LNFEAAVQALADAGVEFIIVGGWSAILHGSAYVTNDLDLFFSRDPENLQRLAAALAPFRPRLRDLPEGLPFLWEAATLANGTIFTLTTDLGAIDLLAEIRGLGSYQDVKAKSVTVEAFGRQIRTLDLRSLIQSKRIIGRDKDVHVVRELESLLEAEEPEA